MIEIASGIFELALVLGVIVLIFFGGLALMAKARGF